MEEGLILFLSELNVRDLFNRKKYRPVEAWSFWGKLKLTVLRMAFTLRRLLGGRDWDAVWPEHHEDPLHMKRRELIYFSHKYYYRAITKADPGSGLETHFRSHAGSLRNDAEFIPEKVITIHSGGDLMPYASINAGVCKGLWDEVGEEFFSADIVTANLETPVVLNKKPGLVPEVMLNHMYFNASEEMMEVFSGNKKHKGYDVLSVANNHSLDQGTQGLEATLRMLREKNIAYCGARHLPDDLHDVPILDRNGIKVAFLAATFSLNAEQLLHGEEWRVDHLPLNKSNPDISRLVLQAKNARAKGADLLVAHLHMGCAYQPYPSMHTVTNMREICRQTGIDVVLGGHPHNPQPLEYFLFIDPFTGIEKQSTIIYSMGDFVAYDIFKWCHLPLVVKMKIGKRGNETRVLQVIPQLWYMQAEKSGGAIESLKFKKADDLLNPDNIELEELKKFRKMFLNY